MSETGPVACATGTWWWRVGKGCGSVREWERSEEGGGAEGLADFREFPS